MCGGQFMRAGRRSMGHATAVAAAGTIRVREAERELAGEGRVLLFRNCDLLSRCRLLLRLSRGRCAWVLLTRVLSPSPPAVLVCVVLSSRSRMGMDSFVPFYVFRAREAMSAQAPPPCFGLLPLREAPAHGCPLSTPPLVLCV